MWCGTTALHITMNLSAGEAMKVLRNAASGTGERTALPDASTVPGRGSFYPKGLNREGLDSRVVPAYLTDRNVLQEPFWKRGLPGGEELQKIRRDNCLMARVETAGPERIQGYSVILGDDNACYEKYLLLLPDGEAEEKSIRSMKLLPAYRQELEENLPDQKNVALGGFCVLREGEQLPAGNYTIAVLVVNRVSKLKLWNTTGKYLTVELPAAKE